MFWKTFKILGCLLILQSGIILLPSLVSMIYGEWYSAAGFLISGIIVGAAGYLIYRLFQNAEDPYSHQAVIIAAACWFVLSATGGLPFFVIACITPIEVMQEFIPREQLMIVPACPISPIRFIASLKASAHLPLPGSQWRYMNRLSDMGYYFTGRLPTGWAGPDLSLWCCLFSGSLQEEVH